jgi:DNA-binding CsgD family transcriptional regulator
MVAMALEFFRTERELGFSRLRETELLALHDSVQARLTEIEAERLRTKAEAGAEVHPPTLDDFGLSSREREVAVLLLDGKSREEIASLLSVTLGTVNTLCTRLYKKAGIRNITELKHKLGRV